MAYFGGPIFITASPADAFWLEHGISLILAERRRDGQRFHPQRLLDMQSELHALAAEPNGTNKVPQQGRFASLSVDDAAAQLNISPEAVRKRCRNGSLAARKIDGSWLIAGDSVEERKREQGRSA